MIEHRRLLNEDPSYVAARAGIETRARAYELGLLRSARAGITRIPVVVHVVWNTAAQNISDAQVQSQINVLNQDYRMTNPDTAQVPAVWQSIRGDARIQFFSRQRIRMETQQTVLRAPRPRLRRSPKQEILSNSQRKAELRRGPLIDTSTFGYASSGAVCWDTHNSLVVPLKQMAS
jgi:hypothetical protein